MKHELLSPVGNMESLYQAIHNGADAVYLGMKNFGARNFAKNFDEKEIKEAVELCHLYGVRIYVTMNTLIKNREVERFLHQLLFLYKLGVDAFIMQDIGMISIVRKKYPNIEIHVSTQANNSSLETIKMFYHLGVKRVVLARELSKDEVKKITFPIELEVFIHGALCISYSGCCLMSSMIGGRSGNRGECVGNCRLLYDLYDGNQKMISNQYLLSTKELNMTHYIKELLNSNIKSFKIEGRMKSPEYVGFITRLYRNLLDQKELDLARREEQLKTLYNRGFTSGHFFKESIMNTKTSNHIGLRIGEVIELTKKKIKIKLNKTLAQEDGIRFLESGKGFIVNYLYNIEGKLISSSNDIVIIDNKVDLRTMDSVYKTQDKRLKESLKNYPLKKLNIQMEFEAYAFKKSVLKVKTGDIEIVEYGEVVELAKSTPLSEESIQRQLQKLGNTCFTSTDTKVVIDSNVFLPIGSINELRRRALNRLEETLKKGERKVEEKPICFSKLEVKDNSKMTCTCYRRDQIEVCLKLGFDRIYIQEKELYDFYKDYPQVYYSTERNLFDSKLVEERALVHELREVENKGQYIGDYTLNVTNIYSAYYLLQNGFLNFCLSPELSDASIENFFSDFQNKFHFDYPFEVLVYGSCCNMVIKGNILKIEEKYFRYQIRNQKNQFFPVYVKNNNTYILNYQKIKRKIKSTLSYVKRFDFYEEDANTIRKIVKKYI